MSPAEPSRPRPSGGQWARLLGAWAVLCVPVSGVLFLVTTFLFAFSGGQVGMVPVVNAAPWLLDLGALAVGAAALAGGRSPATARRALLGVGLGGWVVVVAVEWLLSFRLGAHHPGG